MVEFVAAVRHKHVQEEREHPGQRLTLLQVQAVKKVEIQWRQKRQPVPEGQRSQPRQEGATEKSGT